MRIRTGNISLPASGALDPYLRVTLSAGKVGAADETTVDIGTLAERAYADGDIVAVVPSNATGTVKMVAAGAITAGAVVNAAAGGKVAATGTVKIGTALTAASGDGAHLEVLRQGQLN